MKIEQKSKDDIVYFGNIEVGQCFTYGESDHMYMKMGEKNGVNAVCLNNGIAILVNDIASVIKVRAKVVIE